MRVIRKREDVRELFDNHVYPRLKDCGFVVPQTDAIAFKLLDNTVNGWMRGYCESTVGAPASATIWLRPGLHMHPAALYMVHEFAHYFVASRDIPCDGELEEAVCDLIAYVLLQEFDRTGAILTTYREGDARGPVVDLYQHQRSQLLSHLRAIGGGGQQARAKLLAMIPLVARHLTPAHRDRTAHAMHVIVTAEVDQEPERAWRRRS